MTEVQAACGLAQLSHLPEFVAQRKRNFRILTERLAPLEDRLILPRATPGSDPSWFGFPITIREPGLRSACQKFLLQHGIDSRLLFAGNITRQPYMKGRDFEILEPLTNTDKVMEDGFWVGVWPGLSEGDMEYMGDRIGEFFGEFV